MSGKDFVSKYKSDIDAVKGMKNFEYKMFKYKDNEIDNFDNDLTQGISELADGFDDITSAVKNLSDDEKKDVKSSKKDQAGAEAGTLGFKLGSDSTTASDFESKWKKACDKLKKDAYTFEGTHCDDTSELAEAVFSYLRDGATDSNDKENREFTEVSSLAKILTSSKASSTLSKAQSKSDSGFKKIIASIDKAQNAISDVGGEAMTLISDCVRELSSTVSDIQSASNTIINGYKEAYKERDGAYKACIMAALSHYRKKGKN